MMTPEATLPVIEDDPRLYPNHAEDDVPEGTLHNRWSGYLAYSLAARFPDRFVAGDICVYREPGNYRDYLAPDVFVAGGQVREPPPGVHRTWLLPPLLFAAEIGLAAEQRWEQEARERAAAEERAAEERAQREALEGEVAELRARLAREGS